MIKNRKVRLLLLMLPMFMIVNLIYLQYDNGERESITDIQIAACSQSVYATSNETNIIDSSDQVSEITNIEENQEEEVEPSQLPVNIPEAKTLFPPSGLGSLHTYTIWDHINWGAGCRTLLNFAKERNSISDSYGIVTYGSYFAGATTTTLGTVGDMLLVVETDGYIYPVIIADTKNQHDYGCTSWGHQNGKCMVEFEILSSCRKSLYGSSGGYISEVINKPIYKVINLGSVYGEAYYYYTNPRQACIDNGLSGYTLLVNPYGGITM